MATRERTTSRRISHPRRQEVRFALQLTANKRTGSLTRSRNVPLVLVFYYPYSVRPALAGPFPVLSPISHALVPRIARSNRRARKIRVNSPPVSDLLQERYSTKHGPAHMQKPSLCPNLIFFSVIKITKNRCFAVIADKTFPARELFTSKRSSLIHP
jgi:hypothetical protein